MFIYFLRNGGNKKKWENEINEKKNTTKYVRRKCDQSSWEVREKVLQKKCINVVINRKLIRLKGCTGPRHRFVRRRSVNSNGRRIREGSGASALRTVLFTPTFWIYVSLRNVISRRNDKINSKMRSLQIAARASKEFAEVPRKSAEHTSYSRSYEGMRENLFEYLG